MNETPTTDTPTAATPIVPRGTKPEPKHKRGPGEFSRALREQIRFDAMHRSGDTHTERNRRKRRRKARVA